MLDEIFIYTRQGSVENVVNTFAFKSGRIALIWKDREYSFRFQGFLSNLTKNVIPVSHVL